MNTCMEYLSSKGRLSCDLRWDRGGEGKGVGRNVVGSNIGVGLDRGAAPSSVNDVK